MIGQIIKYPETEQSSHFFFASMFTVKKWFRIRVGLAVVQPWSNKNGCQVSTAEA